MKIETIKNGKPIYITTVNIIQTCKNTYIGESFEPLISFNYYNTNED